MCYLRFIVLTGLLIVGLIGCSPEKTKESTGEDSRIKSKYLIEAGELKAILNEDSIVILDLQNPEDYEKEHIKNAINLWRTELENDSFPYRGMMPEKGRLEQILSSRGLNSDDFLILYDNRGSCEATRLWWILKYYGFERMAILDGGIQSWQGTEELSHKISQNKPGNFRFDGIPNTYLNITHAELKDYVITNSVFLLDTRSQNEYRGLEQKKGASKTGNIPGSIHIDWMKSVDQQTMKFKSDEELHQLFSEILKTDPLIITYCHSGVRSSHTFFVLTELLGYNKVRNYDGSWVEWSWMER